MKGNLRNKQLKEKVEENRNCPMKGHPHYKPAETFPKTCSLHHFMSDLKSEEEKCVWKKIIYLQ